MLRNQSPIPVLLHLSAVLFHFFRFFYILGVIADGQHQLICLKSLGHQIKHQKIRHFMDNEPCLIRRIRFRKHLSDRKRIVLRLIGFNIRHLRGFIAPGMVDQKFRIDPEHVIQQIFIFQGAACHISHGIKAAAFQLPRGSGSYTPEVRQGCVGPEKSAIGHFIQLRDPDSVLIRRHMLCHDVHSDLRQIGIRSDPRRGCDPRFLQHIPDHPDGQLMGCHPVCIQVCRHIDKDLIH